MLEEISLHVLDIALNAVRARASRICINVREDLQRDRLTLIVTDDGCGLDPSEIAQIQNGFYTTKTNRRKKIGLGIALLRQTTEMCQGRFHLFSQKAKGTTVVAMMAHSHIDRPPLGDMATVIWELVIAHPQIDLCYTHTRDRARCTFDTRLVREVLDVSPAEAAAMYQVPEVSEYIHKELAAGETVVEASSTPVQRNLMEAPL